MFVVPVFARTRPNAGRYCEAVARACRSCRPPRASLARRASPSGRSRSRRAATASSRAVTRFERDRPEPSTTRTPASGTPAIARSRRTTEAPAADVPLPITSRPIALSTQLGRVVVAVGVDRLEEVRQRPRVRLREPDRVRPRAAGLRVARLDPARVEHAVEQRRGGERRVGRPRPVVQPRSTTSAESGGDSTTANDGSQPVTVQRRSNHESSPTMWPVTRRMPRA